MTDSGRDVGGAPAAAGNHGSRESRLHALGTEIRALRTGRGMSTVQLARSCGVSPSLISQVERGIVAPSLEVLWAVARALDVPIGTFFQHEADIPAEHDGGDGQEDGRKAIVVRAGQRKRLGLTPSLTYQLLSPDLRRQIEFVWVEFGPGEEGPLEPFIHSGEEQMVVIEGQMTVVIDGEHWVLDKGDCITFDSSLPHRAANRGTRPAVVIAAITPPSF